MADLQYEPKCWGECAHLFADERVAVSLLRVRAGYRCSRHRHAQRANNFVVVSGRISIEEWDSQEASFARVSSLAAGQSHAVPSGMFHRFVVEQSGEVIEVYWPDKGGVVRLDDIERLDEGGAV